MTKLKWPCQITFNGNSKGAVSKDKYPTYQVEGCGNDPGNQQEMTMQANLFSKFAMQFGFIAGKLQKA